MAVNCSQLHIRYDDGDHEWTTSAALALPGNPDAHVQPTKTISRGGFAGFPSWMLWIGLAILLAVARMACREMGRN